MISDLKLAVRQLRKSPGFTFTAIATLALGIGANAIVFSILNALVLRPVDVPQAQNLYSVQHFQWPSQSYLDYIDMRDHNRTFQSLTAFQLVGAVGVDTGGNPSTAWPYLASGNYFDGLGIQPYLGRFFHPSDEKGINSAPYVVLSYSYWHGHFHGDPGVLGRAVDINKHPFTIIGVAPPSFRGTELFFAPAFWIPIVEEPMIQGTDQLQYRGNHSIWVVGHLKPGVTVAQASDDLKAVAIVAGQNLSHRRRRHPAEPRPPWPGRQFPGWACARLHGRPDAALRPHSSRRMRQSRQSLRSARRRSRQRSCPAPRSWIASRPHPSPTAH